MNNCAAIAPQQWMVRNTARREQMEGILRDMMYCREAAQQARPMDLETVHRTERVIAESLGYFVPFLFCGFVYIVLPTYEGAVLRNICMVEHMLNADII